MLKKREKVNKIEFLDYIVRFERQQFVETGKSGIYPSSNLLQIKFGITAERVRQLRNEWEKKLGKNFKEPKERGNK